MSVALTPKQIARRDRSGRLLLEALCLAADGDHLLAHRKLNRAMLDQSCAYGVICGLAEALSRLAEGPIDGPLRWEVDTLPGPPSPHTHPRLAEALTIIGAIVAASVNGDRAGSLRVFDTADAELVLVGAHELLEIVVVTAKAKAGES